MRINYFLGKDLIQGERGRHVFYKEIFRRGWRITLPHFKYSVCTVQHQKKKKSHIPSHPSIHPPPPPSLPPSLPKPLIIASSPRPLRPLLHYPTLPTTLHPWPLQPKYMPRHNNGGAGGAGGGGASGGRGRTKPTREVKISKATSYLLRHGATKEGVALDERGYVNVGELVSLILIFFLLGERKGRGKMSLLSISPPPPFFLIFLIMRVEHVKKGLWFNTNPSKQSPQSPSSPHLLPSPKLTPPPS